MQCEDVRDAGIIEQYVAGRLAEPEVEAFEEHYFGCDACYEALEVATAVRDGFVSGAQAPWHSVWSGRWRRIALAAAAVLLVAGGVGIWQGVTQDPDPRLVALGRLHEPPAYIPSPAFRGVAEADSAQRIFESAMEWYVRGEFTLAARRLESAIALDPSNPQTDFYLGASLLAVGEARAAMDPLERAGREPLLAEQSRFYIARAQLQLGRVEAALETLRSVEEGGGSFAERARQLAAQIVEVTSR